MWNWLQNHWQDIFFILTTVVAGSSVGAKALAPLTSTKKDDKVAKILVRVHKGLNSLALNPKYRPPDA